jgi:lipopolysaccharide export system protein LptC
VVTARAAAQDITKPDVLELEDIRATMDMKGSGTFEVLAQSGVFETKNDKLLLQRNIRLNSANYQATLSEAVVNVRTGNLISEKPVEVTMTQGVVNANRLQVMNSGEIVLFDQGVTVLIHPSQSGGQAGSQ